MNDNKTNIDLQLAIMNEAHNTAQSALQSLVKLAESGIRTSPVMKTIEDLGKQIAALSSSIKMLSNDPLAEALEPVEGDILPPLGSQVYIELASSNRRQRVSVVGYYVWRGLKDQGAHARVFVRVKDEHGIPNARLLEDIFWDEGEKAAA